MRFWFFLFVACSLAGCTSRKPDSANTLHLPTPDKVKTLDPAFADDVYSAPEVGRVYEGLLQYHYLKRPYVLVPNLAETMPEISADRRTYVFHLKKGVRFQDDKCFKETGGKGRELVADDVVYSFMRLADPRVQATGWWVLDRKLEGLNEWRQSMAATTVSGVRALDKYTVQFKLTQPSSMFLYVLAMPFTYIVPREAVEYYGREFLNHPVGTGPFRLEEFSPGSRLVWSKNQNFRHELYPFEGAPGDKDAGLLDDAGKKLPLVDRIEVHVFTEQQPQWLNFLSGKLHLASIPKENFDREKSASLVIQTPMMDVTYDFFNMSDPLIGRNKPLRQAISLAVDAKKFHELFFNGRALLAQGPIPPGLPGYDAGFVNPYGRRDLGRAKELLAQAGFPGGRGLQPLEYVIEATGTMRQMAEFTEKALLAIGIKLKIVSLSLSELQAARRARKGHIFGGAAWSADYPDAENFLQLFYSRNAPGPNEAAYVNQEFDKLYERALTLADGEEKSQLYRRMAAIVIEDCPWIFHVHRVSYDVRAASLRNYKRNLFENTRSKYLRVQELRTE
jgi:ABC-type transport system substrate-binding protein